MIKGTTPNGFTFELEEDRLDDMRTIDMLTRIEKEPGIFPLVGRRILGDAQFDGLLDHLEEKNGKADSKTFMKELVYIFKSNDDTKKS